MKVINLFGAPSAGKSTTMLGLTYHMKLMGLSVENTPEFIKEMIYEGSKTELFGGQLYVLGEQNRRIARLNGKNDFAVTDCPLPLIGYYTPPDYAKGFEDFVKNLNNTYDNVNYYIERKHEFENEKRVHSEDQALEIERKLPKYLDSFGVKYKTVESGENLVQVIIDDLIESKIITLAHLTSSRNAKVRARYLKP
jgi:AAA domain